MIWGPLMRFIAAATGCVAAGGVAASLMLPLPPPVEVLSGPDVLSPPMSPYPYPPVWAGDENFEVIPGAPAPSESYAHDVGVRAAAVESA